MSAPVPAPGDPSTAAIPGGRAGRAFWATFAAVSVLAVLPLWTIGYLPMVDLPQHAAQVSIWQHWDDPAFGYQEVYETNWFTPYLVAYALVRALAFFMPVLAAFKVVLSLAIVALPLALLLLLREHSSNPWWAFLAFPLGYGYSFHWGFVNYVLATPLVLLLWYAGLRFARQPSIARGLGLALFAHLLFFTHVLLFAFGIGSAALLLLARRPSPRAALWQLLPLASAVPLAWIWLSRVRGSEAMTHSAAIWRLGWERWTGLGALVLAEGRSLLAAATFAVLLALPLLTGGRPSKRPEHWVPLACALGAYSLVPLEILGTAFLYPRFAVLVLPGYLLAMAPSPTRPGARRLDFLAPALAAALLASLALRFSGFEREVGEIDQVLARMEPNRRVLSFVFDRSSEYVTGPVFVHFGVWYQSQRGGIADFSFASFFPAVFRYPAARKPPLPGLFEWRPELFRWARHGGETYDYFLIRSARDASEIVFKEARPRVELEMQTGRWWLYRRVQGLPDGDRALPAGDPPSSTPAGGPG